MSFMLKLERRGKPELEIVSRIFDPRTLASCKTLTYSPLGPIAPMIQVREPRPCSMQTPETAASVSITSEANHAVVDLCFDDENEKRRI
jgi:hypothetical protein